MDLTQYLLELSDQLDKEGRTKCANAVDDLIAHSSLHKVAQYVGAIGYVLKQNRAMANCIRKKRVQSQSPMQEVVLDCLKEYQDGQSYHDETWTTKYAEVIKSYPDNFDDIHLSMLNALSQDNNIDEHLGRVTRTAALLQENGYPSQPLDTLVQHMSTFADILQSDNPNFKLAAATPSWWSRLYYPREFSWKNPFSYSKRHRETGIDRHTRLLMDEVLNKIMTMSTSVRRIKTTISRLKSQASGYLGGSTSGLGTYPQSPANENDTVATAIANHINQLDPNDWNKSILNIQQLNTLLRKNEPRNVYNRNYVEMAGRLAQSMSEQIDSIYQNIDDIQKVMAELRQQIPIRALDVNGQPNQSTMASPAEQFGDLERVLDRLYASPFDEKAYFYAQKMHSRLEDRLRYVERPVDSETSEWLHRNPQQPSQAPQVQTNNTAAPDLPDPQAVEEIAKDILEVDIPGLSDQREKANFLANLLNRIFITGGLDSSSSNVVRLLKDRLIAISRGNTTSAWDMPPASAPSSAVAQSEDAYPAPPDFDDESTSFAVSKSYLLKIAQIAAKKDRNLAEIIDKYIQDNTPDVLNTCDIVTENFSYPVPIIKGEPGDKYVLVWK